MPDSKDIQKKDCIAVHVGKIYGLILRLGSLPALAGLLTGGFAFAGADERAGLVKVAGVLNGAGLAGEVFDAGGWSVWV